MTELVRYRELVFDSARWEGFAFRPGDIVISTPPKSGTTWTQMLCALLVFDTAEFHAPMDAISPWLDMQTRSKEEVHALLEGQTHRRFIKTHTPLDGLPLHDDVTYLVVGRDPRDVAISFQHHLANMDFERFLEAREAAVGNHDMDQFDPMEPLPEEPNQRLREFAESDGLVSLARVLQHLHTGWERRHAGNVHLFHYADYSRDLPASLMALAAALGIALTPERAGQLAAEASLGRMRTRAAEVAPDMLHNHWRDPKAFFRKGSAGEWQAGVTPETLSSYERRARELFDDEAFLAWVHDGAGVQLPVSA